jgi:excinuclease UvrABC ATPase subunit
MDIAAVSDWIIDMGPGAGDEGGSWYQVRRKGCVVAPKSDSKIPCKSLKNCGAG